MTNIKTNALIRIQ